MIPIATLASADFGSFMVGGPVFAFDGNVRIGTWEVHSDDRLIPEPATITLLGIGLAGLAASRRRKLNSSRLPTILRNCRSRT